jgi:hypothetical protein
VDFINFDVDFISQADFFAFAVLVVGFLAYAIFTLLAQRGFFKPRLRRLSAYEALPSQVGEAIESGGRVHVSLAGNSIVDESTITSMAGLELLGEVGKRMAISDRSPLGTTADPTTLFLVGDAIRVPAESQDAADRVERTAARLVALDPLSLAAGATSLVADEDVTSNVLIGSFEREAILITEAGERRGISQTVASDRLEGQAVGLVAADHPLIGEELFVSGAYLGERTSPLGSLAAQDVLRWLIAAAVVVGVVLRSIGG